MLNNFGFSEIFYDNADANVKKFIGEVKYGSIDAFKSRKG